MMNHKRITLVLQLNRVCSLLRFSFKTYSDIFALFHIIFHYNRVLFNYLIPFCANELGLFYQILIRNSSSVLQ